MKKRTPTPTLPRSLRSQRKSKNAGTGVLRLSRIVLQLLRRHLKKNIPTQPQAVASAAAAPAAAMKLLAEQISQHLAAASSVLATTMSEAETTPRATDKGTPAVTSSGTRGEGLVSLKAAKILVVKFAGHWNLSRMAFLPVCHMYISLV